MAKTKATTKGWLKLRGEQFSLSIEFDEWPAEESTIEFWRCKRTSAKDPSAPPMDLLVARRDIVYLEAQREKMVQVEEA